MNTEVLQSGGLETRIMSIEAIIPTLATKADLERLRADMTKAMGSMHTDFERGQKENRAWMLGTVLALFVGIVGAGSYFMSGTVRLPAPQQAPIVIYASPPPAPGH